jgi:hypothetical protein
VDASPAELDGKIAATGLRSDVFAQTSQPRDRLLAMHDALSAAGLRHAFGGAIALGYCTHAPRVTSDLDVNVFVAPQRAGEVLDALPEGVARSAEELASAQTDGQVRLWWQDTPIDIFLNAHPFHQEVERGVRIVPFAGTVIPVVGCTTLAVFKSVISRTKDWTDIEEMLALGEMNLSDALAWIAQIVGAEDPAVARLRALGA